MSKTILITGASMGIGAETAKILAPGNTILVHYNSSRAAAEQVAADVAQRGGTAELYQADLTQRAGCFKLFEDVSRAHDHLDVLVNNAGALVKRFLVADFEWEAMETIFALNVYSVMQLSSLFIPLLRQGSDPGIVNLTSIAQRTGAPTSTVYGAAKSAIDSFTRGLARELAPEVRVNAVAPGIIDTPFHDVVTSQERMETAKAQTPLQRHGRPIHVALAIAMLIENDFMTGETIDVNGGLFMR